MKKQHQKTNQQKTKTTRHAMMMKEKYGVKHYIRLNPEGLGDYELQEIENGALRQMERRTSEYLTEITPQLNFLASLLVERH